ncbi:Uncharacterized protein ACO02O_09712 [Dirofilaria immitis]
MLWFYISAIILPTIECNNLMKISTNITAWLASGNPPMIILQNNQMIPLTIDCHQNGKIYKEGESWFTGHLLYKCSKFGIHTILGCRTRKGRPMNIGETYIDDFIAYQCFKENSNIYYRESPCDLLGEPSCSSFKQKGPINCFIDLMIAIKFAILTKPTKLPVANSLDRTGKMKFGHPSIGDLPQGWKIVDSNGEIIPLSRIRVVASYLVNSTPTVTIQRKTKRQMDKNISTS